MTPKRIGLLGFDGVAELGFVGPLQAFSTAVASDSYEADACYEVATIGLSAKPFTAESGLVFRAQYSTASAPELDTLIIPGGRGVRQPEINSQVAQWVAARAESTRRVVSVCTGIYGIAPTGLLDHRRVTTHWRFVRDVARRFPAVAVEENALFLQDGKFYTSAGGTAGIDLSLALIAADCGDAVALGVARDLLVYLRRDGGQEQYSEPAPLQLPGAGELGALAEWIDRHLADDLRLENLADRIGLGKVHFIRQFKSRFGVTPALFIKNRRLNQARLLLLSGENTADVAEAVGFHSTLYFAQEFKWRFGTGPDEYQSRFRFAGGPDACPEDQPAVPRTLTVCTKLKGRRWERRRPTGKIPARPSVKTKRNTDLVLNAA